MSKYKTSNDNQRLYGKADFFLYCGLGLFTAQQVYGSSALEAMTNSQFGRHVQNALNLTPEQAMLYTALGVGILAVATVHKGISKITEKKK